MIYSNYFPFESISVKVPVAPHFSPQETKSTGKTFSAGKHDVLEGKSSFDLSIALNYGQSMGPPQLVRFVTEHTEIVHHPPYSDWDVCMTSGSTSALEVSLRLFCNPGDYVLTEEYSFSSAMETMRPMGLKLLGVKMDEQGILPDDLDHILSNWDTTARKAPKPFVMYIVPSGQNPTGSTQPLSRRKANLLHRRKTRPLHPRRRTILLPPNGTLRLGRHTHYPHPLHPHLRPRLPLQPHPQLPLPRHLRPRPPSRLFLQNNRPRHPRRLGYRPRPDNRAIHS